MHTTTQAAPIYCTLKPIGAQQKNKRKSHNHLRTREYSRRNTKKKNLRFKKPGFFLIKGGCQTAMRKIRVFQIGLGKLK